MMAVVKCLRMRKKVLFIASAVYMYLSSDITRNTIIFSVKQLGLRLVVLLKIMVSPVLYQTIDTRQLLKTIPLFSKFRPGLKLNNFCAYRSYCLCSVKYKVLSSGFSSTQERLIWSITVSCVIICVVSYWNPLTWYYTLNHLSKKEGPLDTQEEVVHKCKVMC